MNQISKFKQGRHRNPFPRSKTIVLSLVISTSGLLSPLVADIPAPGSGNSLPSGVISAPSASLPSQTSTKNAPSWEGGHLPFLITASISEVYDDNIFVQPVKVSDYITQINLKGEYRVGNKEISDGNYLDASYAPSFDLYANHSDQNSFNQNVDVFYQHRFSKLALGLEQIYSKQNSTSASTTGGTNGGLVTSSIYDTHATANYAYSDKFSLVGRFSLDVTDYETAGYSSSNEFIGDLYFLYKYDSKISLGLGPRIGWLDITLAPNQTYQDVLGRVDYLYSGKLSFNLAAGVEVREYEGPDSYTKVSPVFSLSSTYLPSTYTTLTLLGQRKFNPSYNFNGQNYIATSVSISAREKFLEKFHFNLTLGYENDDYEAAGVALAGPAREDNYYFATTGIDWNPNSWLMASIFYKYQKDNSTLATSCFNDNQAGISVGVSY